MRAMPNLTFVMREATANDLSKIMELLQLKAEFDGCPDGLLATPEKLEKDLFGDRPLASVLLVEVEQETVGFATYHPIYSTFLAKPGIWLDDLYLKPEFRRQGIGRAIIQRLCQLADATDCGRIDWLVSTQNDNGIQFYQTMGATIKESVRLCRLDQGAIAQNIKTLA
jgi:GNAT superfamily N-acetyltransferase